jgi:hypothetical protein
MDFISVGFYSFQERVSIRIVGPSPIWAGNDELHGNPESNRSPPNA